MGGTISPRGNTIGTSASSFERQNEEIIIETWNISLELTNSYSSSYEELVKCYVDVLKQVSERCQENPTFKYINTMHEKFEDYNHIFNYRLRLNKLDNSVEPGTIPSTISNSKVSLKTKRSGFKYGIN